MKNTFLLLISFVLVFSLTNCNSGKTTNQSSNDSVENSIKEGNIEVYYFHNERRCATCMAVEEVTESALNELYPEKVKNKEITFQSINIEEDANKDIAEKYQIAGQTLLFISSDNKIDLTNDAFMYAKDTPEKLKEKIKKAVEEI